MHFRHASSALLVLVGSSVAQAFAPTTSTTRQTGRYGVVSRPRARANDDDIDVFAAAASSVTAAALAAALWASPAVLAGPAVSSQWLVGRDVASSVSNGGSAYAKEMASGSGSRVNKDPESLLRYGLPIKNKEVRELQKNIESIRQNVSSKRKAAALDDLKKAKTILGAKGEAKMTASCRDAKVCSSIVSTLNDSASKLNLSLIASQDAQGGSDQERVALDESYLTQDSMQKDLTNLQEQMVPAGYTTPVPAAYADLPQLKGRATIEMTLKRPSGENFDVEGKLFKNAKMTMIIDGYAAPVTGGNFVDLVKKGFYNNMDIQRSDGFVVQTGNPKGEADGYVGTPSKSIGGGKHGERLIPLEIFFKGDKGPTYETSIEDEGRGGEATVLPFSSFGAMGWAREEYEPNTGSSQFFWLLFDSDLTPAGKNLLDGRYPVFGYVVEGADFLRDVREGDVIASASVTQGEENLIQPSS